MVRLGNLLIRTLAVATVCGLGLAACGSQQRPAAPSRTAIGHGAHHDHTVWIYSSLPLRGSERPRSLQVQEGIRLALGPAGDAVPGFHIVYRPLSDSPRPPVRLRRRGGPGVLSPTDRLGSTGTGTGAAQGRDTAQSWSATVTARNAERASRNPQTVAYIGDLSSGATEVSLPIVNQGGILQITPGSGYPGLTDAYKGVTQQNEPGKFYPQSPRNLLRLIPSDIVQAAAALALLHSGGCQTFAAWSFGTAEETAALLSAVIKSAPDYGMKYAPPPKLDPKNLIGYVHALQPSGIRCAILVGDPTREAAQLTLYLREQLSPAPTIVGSSGFCKQAWAQGIPRVYREHVLPGLYCMTPERPIGSYVGARGAGGFIARFRRAYHHRPTAFGYYGYEAARMVMRGLAQAGDGGDYRQQLLDGLAEDIATAGSTTYAFANGGDVLSSAYGVQSFRDGRLTPYRIVTPGPLLPSDG